MLLVVSLGEVASPGDASTELEKTSKIDPQQLKRSPHVKSCLISIGRAPLKIRLPAVEIRKNH
jgi:hypothetical protein